MGQVTIGELTEDLVPYTEKGNKIVNVAIIPRAIAEKAIALCDAQIDFVTQSYEGDDGEITDYGKGTMDFAITVKCYLLSLLAFFEQKETGVEK